MGERRPRSRAAEHLVLHVMRRRHSPNLRFLSGFLGIFAIAAARALLRGGRPRAVVQTHQRVAFAVILVRLLTRGESFEVDRLFARGEPSRAELRR